MSEQLELFPQHRPSPEEILALAEEYKPVARFVGYSSGDDSLAVTHWAMTNVPGCRVLHINTGIGIERAREHARATCARYGWPLVEIRAKEDCGQDYDRIVLKHGFPGPSQHHKMYVQLKERCIEKLCRDNKRRYSRQKIMIMAGIRHDESPVRTGYAGEEVHVVKSQLWVNPLYWWDKGMFMDYIRDNDLPRSPVAEMLGMSGECLCGAHAHEGEKAMVRLVCPSTAERIDRLERAVRDAGHQWGWEERPPREPADDGTGDLFMPMCRGCEKVGAEVVRGFARRGTGE